MVQVETADDWKIAAVHVYVGYPDVNPMPTTKKGNVIPGQFPYKQEYENPVSKYELTLDLKDDLGFSWGSQYREFRTPTLAVHAELVKLDSGTVIAEEGAWAFGNTEFEGSQWGWTSDYQLAHPQRGHFIDSPVVGVGYRGPTQARRHN